MKHITDTRNGPIVTHKGEEYYLQQQAYAENCHDADCGYAYFALASNKDNTKNCVVAWEVLNPSAEEECNACDWDIYTTSDR